MSILFNTEPSFIEGWVRIAEEIPRHIATTSYRDTEAPIEEFLLSEVGASLMRWVLAGYPLRISGGTRTPNKDITEITAYCKSHKVIVQCEKVVDAEGNCVAIEVYPVAYLNALQHRLDRIRNIDVFPGMYDFIEFMQGIDEAAAKAAIIANIELEQKYEFLTED